MSHTKRITFDRRRWTLHLALLFALLASLLPRLVGLPVPTADAHNLQTRMVYMFLDPATQTMLDNRINGGWLPGTPLLQVNDEIGLIIKIVPRDGTTTGVGGHVDFYVPNGVTVTDAGYLLPNGSGGYVQVPMKGQSPIATGDGPIGGKTTSQLIGMSANGPNVNGVTENPVVPSSGLHRGTLAGVYGDTGIFYSTDPDTAWGSWQRFSNAGNPSEVNRCGLVGTFPLGGAKTITNNSGDVYVPCNKWDAEQAFAWGAKATTYGAAGSVPIVDYGDGRGNSPWGFAAATGGPQSGYAWNFDWDEWQASAKTAADMRNAMGNDEIGPWNRIQYPGSRISKDQPGAIGTALGFAGLDGSNVGATMPLPATTSQTDSTSPKTIRWAVGQLTDSRPEYVFAKFKINNTSAILDANGCPVFYADTFGGDAGGTDNGKDHLWRYYEPSIVTWNGCVGIGKPSDRAAVKVGDTFQYKIKFYNLGTLTLTNVVVQDSLPNGVQFISALPAQNSGPNPLVWNVGTLQPGQKFESLVTVKATGSGLLDNIVTVTSNQLPPQTSTETVYSGALALLNPTKSVSPTSVAPGGTVQYTINVQNLGTGSTGNPVTIDEYLPTGFTYVSKDSVVVNGANVTAATTVNTSSPNSTNKPLFTVPAAINAGQSLVLKFTAQASSLAGTYCNFYSLTHNSVPLTTGSLGCVDVGGGVIGDTVYRDWDGDGVQDVEDEGLPGLTVNLYGGVCPPSGPILQTQTTSATGFYQFSGLTAGSYCVDPSGPAGYTLTQGTDPTSVTLAASEKRLNVDFGYHPGGSGSIGDLVFDDKGNDGFFNGADVGIANVTVRLYEDSNGNGLIESGDALIGTTTTNGSGVYSFTGLAEGLNYIVDVDQSDPDLNTYFGGGAYVLTTADPQPVANLSGAYLNADFGFYKVVPGSIGDLVWFDANGNGAPDGGENGIANVTVFLYQDSNGNGVLDSGEPLLGTTSTNASGNYSFNNLPAGNYIVDVDEGDPDIPEPYAAARDPIAVTLGVAQAKTDVDFPFVQTLAKSVDKTTATVGEQLTYTLYPRYFGDKLLAGVVVNDTIPAGTTYVAASINPGAPSGEAIDDDEPVDGVVDYVAWDLGSNSPGSPGYSGGIAMCPATATIEADKDTWIFEKSDSVARNYGGENLIETANKAGEDQVGLLHFPVTALPAGAVLDKVVLKLTVQGSQGTNRGISLHELLTAWTEGTGTADACSSSGNGAAWQGPNCTDAWLTGADVFGASDYNAISLGTIDPLIKEVPYEVTGSDLKTLVSSWAAGGTNHGIAMIPNGSATNAVTWYAKQTATTAWRPQLVLTYRTPTAGGCTGTVTLTDIADSYIEEDSGGNDNFGTDAEMKVRPENTKRKHALLKFDVSSVPVSSTVTAATLKVIVKTAKTNVTSEIHRLTTNWVEGTSATDGVQWNDPNGTGSAGTWAASAFSASDYNASIIGSIAPSSTGQKTADVKSLVEGWNNGTFPNYGMVLLSTGT